MAGLVGDGDRESRVGRDLEGGVCGDGLTLFCSIEHNLTGSTDDLHEFGSFCAEVVSAGQDHAEGFLGTVREDDGVGDNVAIEVDVGLGVSGDVVEFHGRFHVVWEGEDQGEIEAPTGARPVEAGRFGSCQSEAR